MSGAGSGNIMPETSDWESELWTHLSTSDGNQCPLYDFCQERQGGGNCFDDIKLDLDQVAEYQQFNLADYNFIRPAGSCKIYSMIQRLAQQYLRKSGISRLPVPTEIISLADEKHPIEIRTVPLKTCHGALWGLQDAWVIHLNSNDPISIQRFTLFHEAFHILAHRNSTPIFCNRKSIQAPFNEALACLFAGFVLQPEDWLRQKWAEVKDLDRMAEIFQVSKPVMCVALKSSGLL